MSQLREEITALFEEHRAAPGASFEVKNFLDFLMADPRAERAVYNSFSGLRRFNAFIDAVQLECAVCFSRKDRDANYSLEKFVARVEELQRSPRGSLVSLGNQDRAGPDVNFVIIANAILLGLLALLRSSLVAAGSVLALAAVFNLWYVTFYARSRKYQNKLRRRIQSAYGIAAQSPPQKSA